MESILEDAVIALTNQSEYVSYVCDVLFADLPKKEASKFTKKINDTFLDFCKSAWSLEQGGSKEISFVKFKFSIIEILFNTYSDAEKIPRKGIDLHQAEIFIKDIDIFADQVTEELKSLNQVLH